MNTPVSEPAVTSRRLVNHGIDTTARDRFFAAQKRAALKMGKSEEDAIEHAQLMTDMYGHHFRDYR